MNRTTPTSIFNLLLKRQQTPRIFLRASSTEVPSFGSEYQNITYNRNPVPNPNIEISQRHLMAHGDTLRAFPNPLHIPAIKPSLDRTHFCIQVTHF